MRRGVATLTICLALGSGATAALANPTKSRFSDARFETGGMIVMEAQNAKDRFVFLWVYQSKLGEYLNKRPPSSAEVAEMQRLCKSMDRMARKQQGQGLDGYGIEFADGTGDTSDLPLSRRAVFFFWAKAGEETCAPTPSNGRIS